MALDVFDNSLTAQKVVAAADRLSGSPGYYLNSSAAEDLTAPAYIELQAILNHLAQWFDWPFRDDAVTITVSSRATGLPHDYWRASFSCAFMIHPTSGMRTPLILMGHREFHERVNPSELGTGLPTIGTIMKNAGGALGGVAEGTLYTDHAPDVSYLCELHYDPVASPLAAITTVPWFPDSHYLITKLAAKLCAYQDDSRAPLLDAEAERIMSRIHQGKSDPGQRGHVIRLDETVFRNPLRLVT